MSWVRISAISPDRDAAKGGKKSSMFKSHKYVFFHLSVSGISEASASSIILSLHPGQHICLHHFLQLLPNRPLYKKEHPDSAWRTSCPEYDLFLLFPVLCVPAKSSLPSTKWLCLLGILCHPVWNSCQHHGDMDWSQLFQSLHYFLGI